MDSQVVRIKRFVKRLGSEVDAAQDGDVHHGLYVVLRQCGFKRRGSRNVSTINEALRAQGIHARPQLAVAEYDERIRFSRKVPEPCVPAHRLLHTERALERLIYENFTFADPLTSLTSPECQKRLPSGKYIDVLARDKNTGEYVVIELKVGSPDGRLLQQMISYLVEVEDAWAGKDGSGVRGVIVTGRVDPLLLRSLEAIKYRIDWLTYEVQLTLQPVGEAVK